MLKTQRGQVNLPNNVQIPVINFKTLGLTENGKAFKDYFTTHFIVVGRYVQTEDGATFQVGSVTTDEGRNQVFKYSWSQPDDDKPAKKGEMPLQWRSIMWSDSLLRKSDGDSFDDPGFALGLNLPQDERKSSPGLHGAPSGKYPMIDPFVSTVRIPVIWKVAMNDEGEIDTKTGELVWLDLSFYQYQNLMESIALYDKQMTAVLRKAKSTPNAERLFVVNYVKDPKAEMRERNAIQLVDAIDPSDWTKRFTDVALLEYPKMLESLEKRYTFYKPIVDELVNGQIDTETANARVHAAIAEKLLVGWGEIDEVNDLSVEEINETFLRLVPMYSTAMTDTPIPASAIKQKKVVDLGDENPF